jgi:hypothetical protein
VFNKMVKINYFEYKVGCLHNDFYFLAQVDTNMNDFAYFDDTFGHYKISSLNHHLYY